MFCEPPQKKSVFFKEIQRVTPKKQATYIRYVIGKLLKFVQITMQTS